jgi:SSS family solute:Na+ symporter
MIPALIVTGYLAALVVLGLAARRRAKPGHEDFFLAGRGIGPVMLFLTMAATNFSAFTVFGMSGAGYRIGYAYYPIMAFGTGFMALTFILLGIPLWRAAKRLGAVTPPEIIRLRFANRPLHLAYLAVMVVFTLPYLAIQPMGAGYALQGLLGIPYVWGAVLVTAVGLGYLLVGGMRGDVWTDALQGVLMLVAMTAVLLGLAHAFGGFTAANRQVYARWPELFSRPGGGAAFPLGVWFSYMALWFLCDPMFPQLFQRFLAAKDERALRTTTILYPLVTGLLFFMPVAIGVMGRLVEPNLAAKAADSILPLAVARLLPKWIGAIALVGGLSALMSTMDSQLLTLSSMIVRDLGGDRPRSSFIVRFLLRPRVAMTLLAMAGLAIALRPWGPILEIATETFTGLAVLFPVTLAAIYWRKTNPWAGFASILVGEALVVLYHFKLLPAFGFLPVIPVIVVTTLVLAVGSLLWPATRFSPLASRLSPLAPVTARGWRWAAIFTFVFLLGNDFWAWHKSAVLWFGLPSWLWYYFGLILLLFGLMATAFRERKERPTDQP